MIDQADTALSLTGRVHFSDSDFDVLVCTYHRVSRNKGAGFMEFHDSHLTSNLTSQTNFNYINLDFCAQDPYSEGIQVRNWDSVTKV